MMLFKFQVAVLVVINFVVSCSSNLLIYGNGKTFDQSTLKQEIKNVLTRGIIKVDPFCTAILGAIYRDDLAIKAFYDFIFTEYEHFAYEFDTYRAETWDFLINQALIQYIERKNELGLSEEVESDIINPIVIPKYPILNLLEYKFDSKSFVEDYFFRGDLTGHFEEAQVSLFFKRLNEIITMKNDEDFDTEKKYIDLLTAAKMYLEPETVPYIDFLLNTPLYWMKRVYIPFGEFLTEFKFALIRFVTINVFKFIRKESPEIIETIMQRLKQDSSSNDTKYFKFLMKFYEDHPEICLFYDPLKEFLMKSIKEENFEQVKLLKDAFEFLKRETVDDAIRLSLKLDNDIIFEFLMNNQPEESTQEQCNGFNSFKTAVSKDKRKILNLFTTGKIVRPSIDMWGDSLVDILKNGNYDMIIHILIKKYKPGLASKNLRNLMIETIELYLNMETETVIDSRIERILWLILRSETPPYGVELIFKEDLKAAYDLVFKKGNLKLLALFLDFRKVVARIDYEEEISKKFIEAIEAKNWEMVEIFLNSKSLDDKTIFKCHMEALENGCDDAIFIFEFFYSTNDYREISN